MSTNTHYYGEIVARIAGHLHSLSTEDLATNRFSHIAKDVSIDDMICELSADAGRVFDLLEDISGEHFIDWKKALEHYAMHLRSSIIDGRMPSMADMISMAAKSMDVSRPEVLECTGNML